jgi:hypothetical protein
MEILGTLIDTLGIVDIRVLLAFISVFGLGVIGFFAAVFALLD